MQHHRKCHPSQMDITENTTFGTTDKYSRSDMYTRCSFPVFCSLSPGSLFLADNKEQSNEL